MFVSFDPMRPKPFELIEKKSDVHGKSTDNSNGLDVVQNQNEPGLSSCAATADSLSRKAPVAFEQAMYLGLEPKENC